MSNTYEKQARKRGLLGAINEAETTKHDIKSTLAQTGMDLLLGGIAGSFAGHLTGRWSLLGGVVVTGTSYYLGSRMAASFGVGMMSAGFVNVVNGTDGLSGTTLMDTVKQRSKVFADGLKARLFLDKLIKPKTAETTTTTTTETPTVSGVGNVRYFMYPQNDSQIAGPAQMDLSALDRIQQQVAESAREYQSQSQMQQVSGLAGPLNDLLTEHIM